MSGFGDGVVKRSTPSAEVLEVDELAALIRMPGPGLVPARDADALRIAFIVPSFFRGSGGHTTISNVIRGLEQRGHHLSIWIDDVGARNSDLADVPAAFREWFGPFAAEVHEGFDAWRGADVVVATAWQTAFRARALGDVSARAYFVQDHEIEFFSGSYQRRWAEDSYRLGLYPVTAGSWLAQLMRETYGQDASHFELGVDAELYRPVEGVARRENVVAFYGRGWTPRRAVPVVLAAVSELKRRRPETELWSFGESWLQPIDVPVDNRGILSGPELAQLYSEATVGLVLSMTNYSLVAQEMTACGMPCVELDAPSSRAAFGADSAVELAPLDPTAIAEHLARLLDDPQLRARRVAAGRELLATRTWAAAAERVEEGLREAIRRGAG